MLIRIDFERQNDECSSHTQPGFRASRTCVRSCVSPTDQGAATERDYMDRKTLILLLTCHKWMAAVAALTLAGSAYAGTINFDDVDAGGADGSGAVH